MNLVKLAILNTWSERGIRMKYTIDRIEEAIVICEDETGNQAKLCMEQLPDNAVEGDILEMVDGVWIIDVAETQKRKDAMRQKLKRRIE